MSSLQEIKAKVDQIPPEVLDEGNQEYVRMSKLGQLFTADWKQRFFLAGKLWAVSVGGLTAGGNISRVTGGGAGTTVDQDQPEIGIGVDTGYWLFAVSIMVSAYADIDAADDYANIIATADRAATVPTGTDGVTANTPVNLLDGAETFPGRVHAPIHADITDPTVSEVLDEVSQVSDATNVDVHSLRMDYNPDVPSLLAGPCAIYIYWGGTVAVTAVARVVIGCVPTSWFPAS